MENPLPPTQPVSLVRVVWYRSADFGCEKELERAIQVPCPPLCNPLLVGNPALHRIS